MLSQQPSYAMRSQLQKLDIFPSSTELIPPLDVTRSMLPPDAHGFDLPNATQPSRSKRKHEDDTMDASDGLNDSKKVKRRRGKLYMLLDMPLDILYEIFGHLEPLDLLRLARTSKDLRRLLMKPSGSISIWRAARSNVGLPPPPDSMSEPAFADLVFSGYCHSCLCTMRQTENILWVVATRLCGGCRMKVFRPSWTLLASTNLTVDQLKLRECVPSDKEIRFMEPMVTKHVDEYLKHVGDRDELDAWFKKKIASMTARRENAEKYEAWMRMREEQRVKERENTRERRQKAILKKLGALGWQEEIDQLTPSSDFHSFPLVKEPRELTDRVWNRIKDPIIALMEQTKAIRMHQVVYRSRYEVLRKMYPIYCNRQHPSILLPNIGDIIGLESVKRTAERESQGATPLDNIFDFLSPELRDISQTLYDIRRVELLSIVRREVPEFELADLSLATTVFKCTAGKCSSRRLTFPLVLTHGCASSYSFKRTTMRELRNDQKWFGSSSWNQGGDRIEYDLEGSQIVRTFVETLELDPSIVTVDTLNELCLIVECKACSGNASNRRLMFWMHALNHRGYHRGQSWNFELYTRFNVPENTAFLEAEHKAVITNSNPSKLPPVKKIFACSHCNWESEDIRSDLSVAQPRQQCRFSRRELIEHLSSIHKKPVLQRSDWEWTANVSLHDIPTHLYCATRNSQSLGHSGWIPS